LDAYCVKCKTKREIKDPQPVFTDNATPATRGVCPVCGTTLYRMGRTEAHEGMTAPERGAQSKARRKGKLVIVESPAKAKTVGRFLGKDYTVRASVGHVRDLLRSQLSVDVENGFTPKYRVMNEKRAVVNELKALVKTAEEIYLATDPDREGEAIAWHLVESAQIDPKLTQRVVFHEITEPAVAEAFANPRGINMDLVDAQQARRVLDRLVGYKLSPLLWRKVRSRLSAGRVQSVALKLVVEREREIDAFVRWNTGRSKPSSSLRASKRPLSPNWQKLTQRNRFWTRKRQSSRFWRIWRRRLTPSVRSSTASAGAPRMRLSLPALCNRKLRAGLATPPAGRWPSLNSFRTASTSVRVGALD